MSVAGLSFETATRRTGFWVAHRLVAVVMRVCTADNWSMSCETRWVLSFMSGWAEFESEDISENLENDRASFLGVIFSEENAVTQSKRVLKLVPSSCSFEESLAECVPRNISEIQNLFLCPPSLRNDDAKYDVLCK